jgi:hypothetical protein
MLEVEKNLKIKKGNISTPITKYKLTFLQLDLHTNKIFIRVDFYRKQQLVLTKDYDCGEAGDVDVNELIKRIHKEIND